jgi:hypothetical protein
MVNPEELTARGLRAYELGRFITASRVALILVPLAALCLLENTGREVCACLSVVLLGSAVWLRWRDRKGWQSVTTGLLAGGPPLAAGIALARFDLTCGTSGAESFCTGLSVIVGMTAGLLIAARETRWRGRFTSYLTAGVIAALAAGLGCVRLGVLGVASMVVGIAVGAAVGALFLRRAPA